MSRLSYTLQPVSEFREDVSSALDSLMESDLRRSGITASYDDYLSEALSRWWSYLRDCFQCRYKDAMVRWETADFIHGIQHYAGVTEPRMEYAGGRLIRFNMPSRDWYLEDRCLGTDEPDCQLIFLKSHPAGICLLATERTAEMLSALDREYGNIVSALEKTKLEVSRRHLLALIESTTEEKS